MLNFMPSRPKEPHISISTSVITIITITVVSGCIRSGSITTAAPASPTNNTKNKDACIRKYGSYIEYICISSQHRGVIPSKMLNTPQTPTNRQVYGIARCVRSETRLFMALVLHQRGPLTRWFGGHGVQGFLTGWEERVCVVWLLHTPILFAGY
jgi:hypothetical protein